MLSQNLIQNPSFEDFSGCPTSYAQIDSALFWTSASEGSPDYFNACTTFDLYDVPANTFGNQVPKTGQSYAGLLLWTDVSGEWREYIEVQLSEPLVPRACYHFEMFVNLGESSSYTTHDIGVYFSNTLVSFNNHIALPFIPQINNSTGNSFNFLDWTKVSGDYTANGGESYLTIGNFKDNATMDKTFIDFNYVVRLLYCYVDDVSLVSCVKSSVGEADLSENHCFYPNPFEDKLVFLNESNAPTTITIYDISARKVIHQHALGSTTFNTEKLDKGVYIYKILSQNGICKSGLLVKD